MKNWKKAGIGALCVMSLLAGCGMQGGKDDGNGGKDDTPMDVTLETLREVNDPCMLLEKYDAVTVSIQGTDRDGEVTYTARLQYTDGGDSTILMSSHYSYTANSGPGEDELWSQGRGGLYATRMTSDDTASLNIYPIPGEGTEYLSLTYCHSAPIPPPKTPRKRSTSAASRTARCCSRPPRAFKTPAATTIPPSTTPIPRRESCSPCP